MSRCVDHGFTIHGFGNQTDLCLVLIQTVRWSCFPQRFSFPFTGFRVCLRFCLGCMVVQCSEPPKRPVFFHYGNASIAGWAPAKSKMVVVQVPCAPHDLGWRPRSTASLS